MSLSHQAKDSCTAGYTHTLRASSLRCAYAPPDTYYSILLGDLITGVIRPSKGRYHDCVLDGRRTIPRAEFNLGVGGLGSPRFPVDLDTWTFYCLPVLGEEGFLIGAPKSDTTLNTARFMLPHMDPSQFSDNLSVGILLSSA